MKASHLKTGFLILFVSLSLRASQKGISKDDDNEDDAR